MMIIIMMTTTSTTKTMMMMMTIITFNCCNRLVPATVSATVAAIIFEIFITKSYTKYRKKVQQNPKRIQYCNQLLGLSTRRSLHCNRLRQSVAATSCNDNRAFSYVTCVPVVSWVRLNCYANARSTAAMNDVLLLNIIFVYLLTLSYWLFVSYGRRLLEPRD